MARKPEKKEFSFMIRMTRTERDLIARLAGTRRGSSELVRQLVAAEAARRGIKSEVQDGQ